MRLSRDEIETLAQTFSTSNMDPPHTALFAFVSLLADDKLAESIGESFTDAQGRTVWVLTGITDASLIRVQASSPCDGWSRHKAGSDGERQGEDLEATRWPLSALRSLKVAGVRDTTEPSDNSQYESEAVWVVTLTDGEEVSVPASRTLPFRVDSERVKSLIEVIRSRI